MKNYRITVNGNVYDVSVEELNGSVASVPVMQTSVPAVTPKVSQPVATPAGAVTITSPMPGKIISVKVNVGAAVKKDDIIMILEAMKMENEIVASQDGIVASINVNEGAAVEAGTVLASLN